MQSFLSLFQVSPHASSGQAGARAPQGTSQTASPTAVPGVPDALVQAFASASQTTGLPFDYFLTTAQRESSLDVNAAASTSSARGPFQFIEQTWLGMVHEHGQALGFGQEAAAVERRADGRFVVSDPAARQAVLDLRYNPEVSAVMSGLYLQSNAQDLQNVLGRPVTVGEGYVAHVFGPSGGGRLIALAEQQPGRAAADVFPTQARSNPGLFYDRGQPVSVRDLYDRLVDGFPRDPVQTGQMQTARLERGPAPAPAPAPVVRTEPLSLQPDGFDTLPTVSEPDVLARHGLFTAASSTMVQPTQDPPADPFFKALFRADGYRTPDLAQESAEEMVSTHDGADIAPPAPVSRPDGPAPVGQPVDLVQFVQSGQLAASYRNPARDVAGTELVDRV